MTEAQKQLIEDAAKAIEAIDDAIYGTNFEDYAAAAIRVALEAAAKVAENGDWGKAGLEMAFAIRALIPKGDQL